MQLRRAGESHVLASTSPRHEFCAKVDAKTRAVAGTLPKMGDKETRILSMTSNDCHLSSRYQMVNYGKEELVVADLLEMLRAQAMQSCSDKTVNSVFHYQGSIRSVYVDRNLEPIGEVVISYTDCPPIP